MIFHGKASRLPALAVSCAFAVSGSAFAANEARVDLGVMVPPLQWMDVVQPALVMPELTVDALFPGYIVLPRTIELRISSNTDWVLQIRQDDRPDAHGPRTEVARAGEEEYRPISGDWVEVARGDAGPDIALELRVRVALEDAGLHSGAYETRFDYRLAGAGE